MPLESSDAIFTREMRRIRLASKYPITAANKLPIKRLVQQAYKGRKVPIAVDVRVTLRDAALKKKIVRITYKKTTTGEVKVYNIEPYSFRYLRLNVGVRKMLFGWDVKEKRIKSFAIRNITKIDMTQSAFSPRFPVEIGKRMRRRSIHRPGR